jgi:SAM-dependent methyltransferase
MVRSAWICSIDAMTPLQSEHYAAVFSNYVLEHVENMAGAAREVLRVLAPGGLYLATIPNPKAVEFVIADHTPLWFHKVVRQKNAWETVYAYEGVAELLDLFAASGFEIVEERRWPFVEGYLGKFPLVNLLGRAYDSALMAGNLRKYMGDVCVVLRKPRE